MPKLGTKKRPIIVKITSQDQAAEVASICDEHNWHFIAGFEEEEDLTDLNKALASLESAPSKPKLTAASIPSRKKKRRKR